MLCGAECSCTIAASDSIDAMSNSDWVFVRVFCVRLQVNFLPVYQFSVAGFKIHSKPNGFIISSARQKIAQINRIMRKHMSAVRNLFQRIALAVKKEA